MEINLEKKVKLSCFSAAIAENIQKRLFGEVFTVLDASIADLSSRKAVKSLISQSFTRACNRIMSELNSIPESVEKVQKSG